MFTLTKFNVSASRVRIFKRSRSIFLLEVWVSKGQSSTRRRTPNKSNPLRYGASLLAIFACFDAAHAQTAPAPPVIQTVDPKGVDLFNGKLVVTSAPLSIGNDSNGMTYRRWNMGLGWSDNVAGYISQSGSNVIVYTGENSDSFTVSGGTYTSATGDGATLTYNSLTYLYTYTRRDGTVYNFDHTTYNTDYPANAIAVLLNYTKPSGELISISWTGLRFCTNIDTGTHCATYERIERPAGITSSNGYSIGFNYIE